MSRGWCACSALCERGSDAPPQRPRPERRLRGGRHLALQPPDLRRQSITERVAWREPELAACACRVGARRAYVTPLDRMAVERDAPSGETLDDPDSVED